MLNRPVGRLIKVVHSEFPKEEYVVIEETDFNPETMKLWEPKPHVVEEVTNGSESGSGRRRGKPAL